MQIEPALALPNFQPNPRKHRAPFSRIRNTDLGRFTLDRLVSIINRLGSRVEVKIKVRAVPLAEPITA
jgi:hypothetical protein